MSASSSPPTSQMQQTINFPGGGSLGISVDDVLNVRRVNDPDSAAIKAARYGVIHWRVVAVAGAAVASKADLVRELKARASEATIPVTFEAPATEGPVTSPRVIKRTLDALSGKADDAGKGGDDAAGRAFLKRLKAQHRPKPPPAPDADGAKGTRPSLPPAPSLVPSVDAGDAITLTRVVAGSCTWRLNREDAEKADDVARRACAAHAVVGIRTFDCGDIYAGVEDLVGRFLATARGQHRALFESVRLHTKVAPDLDALARLQPVAGEAPAAQRQREAAVARFVEGSVWRSANRLSASVVDLVYLHWWDWNQWGFVAALRALAQLRERGVVKEVGVTNIDAPRLRPLLETPPPGCPKIACVQVNLSVVDRRAVATGLGELCQTHGVRLLAHGALMGGLLSKTWLGAPPPEDGAHPNFTSNLVLIDAFGGWGRFQDVLRALDLVASAKATALGCRVTLSMVAIAWTLAQPGVGAVVLGARDADHVKDAGVAASRLELGGDDLAAIDAAAAGAPGPAGEVYGLERDDASVSVHSERNGSLAATTTHFRECARRLAELHRLYAAHLPEAPAGLFEAPPPPRGKGLAPWTAVSAYANLELTELVYVLRGFVSEIDCLPAPPGSDGGDDASPAPEVAKLRTFAARMLAATEQALFVAQKRGAPGRGRGLRLPAASANRSYDSTTRAAAHAAQDAFRARVLAACLDADKPAGAAGGELPPNCAIM